MTRSILFCTLLLIAFSIHGQRKKTMNGVTIKWVSSIKSDFSFVNNWIYPDDIVLNEHGQLSCDGLCPEDIYNMIDSTGNILKDSLSAYYKIIDTTHQFQSIQSKAWCYEWAGTNFIEAIQKSVDTVYCYTLLNAVTHCSLQLNIVGDKCLATIDLNSIIKGGSLKYVCNNGYITVDKSFWGKGILKAIFNFNFENKEEPSKPIYWKGKIFTKIKTT